MYSNVLLIFKDNWRQRL